MDFDFNRVVSLSTTLSPQEIGFPSTDSRVDKSTQSLLSLRASTVYIQHTIVSRLVIAQNGTDATAKHNTSRAEDMKEWYAVRSKPRREVFAASQLTRAGIEVYVPQIRVYRQHGKASVFQPFFPGYFFGRLDPQQAEIHMANYTPGVLYVVGYADEAAPVPDDLIVSIQQRLARVRGKGPAVDFRPGDPVVITSGPLQGLDAIFDCSLSSTGRVRVLIQLLKRVCRAEVRISQLRRADKVVGQTVA